MDLRKKRGFTLVELQIAGLLMIVVLIATGVVFYFSLNSVRFLTDAFEVYYNASNAERVISAEIMKANCYGWSQGAAWDSLVPADSFYGAGGIANPTTMPTVGAIPSTSDHIYLRSATQASTWYGSVDDLAEEFDNHEVILFSRGQIFNGVDWINALFVEWSGSFAAIGTGDLVAQDISNLTFYALTYNCVGFSVEVTGRVPDPLTGNFNVVRFDKVVTLRCAPLRWPVPETTAGVW